MFIFRSIEKKIIPDRKKYSFLAIALPVFYRLFFFLLITG